MNQTTQKIKRPYKAIFLMVLLHTLNLKNDFFGFTFGAQIYL